MKLITMNAYKHFKMTRLKPFKKLELFIQCKCVLWNLLVAYQKQIESYVVFKVFHNNEDEGQYVLHIPYWLRFNRLYRCIDLAQKNTISLKKYERLCRILTLRIFNFLKNGSFIKADSYSFTYFYFLPNLKLGCPEEDFKKLKLFIKNIKITIMIINKMAFYKALTFPLSFRQQAFYSLCFSGLHH